MIPAKIRNTVTVENAGVGSCYSGFNSLGGNIIDTLISTDLENYQAKRFHLSVDVESSSSTESAEIVAIMIATSTAEVIYPFDHLAVPANGRMLTGVDVIFPNLSINSVLIQFTKVPDGTLAVSWSLLELR